MDTLVSIHIVAPQSEDEAMERTERAFGWFRYVERVCSRFDEESEVMQLKARSGTPLRVSTLLFEMLRFAIELARLTKGAFDPTVGYALERRGFNRHYLSGQTIASNIEETEHTSYRDVFLDANEQTVTLRKPLILDLGGVAKGMAIDLAARELAPFAHYSLDAGGDLYVKGRNERGECWRVGLQHPRQEHTFFSLLRASNTAICTSGDYERTSLLQKGEHHLIDPDNGTSPEEVTSATVIAPDAMLADALSTAAFVLGPTRGLRLLRQCGVEGVLIAPSLEMYATPGFKRFLQR